MGNKTQLPVGSRKEEEEPEGGSCRKFYERGVSGLEGNLQHDCELEDVRKKGREELEQSIVNNKITSGGSFGKGRQKSLTGGRGRVDKRKTINRRESPISKEKRSTMRGRDIPTGIGKKWDAP